MSLFEHESSCSRGRIIVSEGVLVIGVQVEDGRRFSSVERGPRILARLLQILDGHLHGGLRQGEIFSVGDKPATVQSMQVFFSDRDADTVVFVVAVVPGPGRPTFFELGQEEMTALHGALSRMETLRAAAADLQARRRRHAAA